MYHYKARIYSPTLGRLLQTDPIGYDDQFNLYTYVGADPVNKVDPDGTDEACIYTSGCNFKGPTFGEVLISEAKEFAKHAWEGTTGLPPTFSGGTNAVTTPLRAANAFRLSIATRTAVKIEAKASSLAVQAGKNSVTVRTQGGFKRVDLAGKPHYSKELGRYVSTPHVQSYKENFVNGISKGFSKIGDAVPATMKDLKAVEDTLKKLNR